MKYTVEVNNGNVRWYKEGTNILHRIDGPATEYANGDKFWYQNGKLHRIDGPAKEYAGGDKVWYQNDQLHRLDGPACEYANGTKFWFYQGDYIKCSSQEKFEKIIKEKYTPKTNSCTDKIINIDGKKYKLIAVE